MTEVEEIFVRLLDESVEVWRPVRARHLGDDRYLIVEQPYERELERWEFAPQEEVVCAMVPADDGAILAAVRRSAPGSR